MRHLNVLWNEGSIDISVIERFERKIGYRFPENYKQLLSAHDGLMIKEDTFKFKNIYGKEDIRDVAFYGYGPTCIEKIENSQNFDIYGYEGIVAIGRSANGDHICFDYRHEPTTTEPHVVLMYHDDSIIDENGNEKMVVNFVAPNFEALVDLLYEPDDEED
ncbi:MAG: SMI1/KNR4 family protein [Candidatus Accumulibacter sp.]|jgi:cell wall assembly regulator SMI1|nr:SMI1/KNR4 family protein [Accumulibacter sp.]